MIGQLRFWNRRDDDLQLTHSRSRNHSDVDDPVGAQLVGSAGGQPDVPTANVDAVAARCQPFEAELATHKVELRVEMPTIPLSSADHGNVGRNVTWMPAGSAEFDSSEDLPVAGEVS